MLEISQNLQKTIEETNARLSSLDKSLLDYKPAPDKWSKKEILGHLIDSASNNLQRFVRGQYENEPHVVYDQDRWVKLQNYQAMPFEDVFRLWKSTNQLIVNVLKNMDPSTLERKCNVGKEKKELVSLSWLAKDYLTHTHHHLEQIFA